jgi:hypothetical protein
VASNFDHIVVVTPYDNTCGYSGVGWVGANGVRFNGTLDHGVIDHELGHNLGLWHAGTLDCGGGAIGASCTRVDCGDRYDVMGGATAYHHFNAAHKQKLGWLASCRLTRCARSRPARRRSP